MKFLRPICITHIGLRIGGCVFLALLMCLCQAQAENSLETDVCVYGGTLGGITAALAAARRRSDVVMNEPLRHLGALVFKEEYLAFQEVKKANPDWANKLKERRTQPQR